MPAPDRYVCMEVYIMSVYPSLSGVFHEQKEPGGCSFVRASGLIMRR